MDNPLCSSCGHSMTDPITGISVIGIHFDAISRIYPELPLPFKIMICYICWVKSLGVNVAQLAEMHKGVNRADN